jgi:hypothetical protein
LEPGLLRGHKEDFAGEAESGRVLEEMGQPVKGRERVHHTREAAVRRGTVEVASEPKLTWESLQAPSLALNKMVDSLSKIHRRQFLKNDLQTRYACL